MKDTELNSDFRDLLLGFADAAVDFVIVGAHAVGYHGLPRATQDLDVFIRPSRDNAERVYRAQYLQLVKSAPTGALFSIRSTALGMNISL